MVDRKGGRGATFNKRPKSQQIQPAKQKKAKAPKPQKREAGAKGAATGITDRIGSWYGNHVTVMVDALQRLLRQPASSAMTCAVIAIALALPAGFFVALANVEKLSAGWDGKPSISLYLKSSIEEGAGRSLAKEIEGREAVSSTRYISREESLQEFERVSGFGDIMQSLDRNPLPAVIVVNLPERAVPADVQLLKGKLEALAEVDEAQLDMEWVQRLHSILSLVQRLTIALALMLAVGVVLVIGNTIKLAIESRRDEILVVKLVGGTNAFVRRPFLYTGLWYGLGGGLLAWFLVQFALLWLSSPISKLVLAYQSAYTLQGLGVFYGFSLIIGAALLGLAGAWLVVGRQIKAIEPQ